MVKRNPNQTTSPYRPYSLVERLSRENNKRDQLSLSLTAILGSLSSLVGRDYYQIASILTFEHQGKGTVIQISNWPDIERTSYLHAARYELPNSRQIQDIREIETVLFRYSLRGGKFDTDLFKYIGLEPIGNWRLGAYAASFLTLPFMHCIHQTEEVNLQNTASLHDKVVTPDFFLRPGNGMLDLIPFDFKSMTWLTEENHVSVGWLKTLIGIVESTAISDLTELHIATLINPLP